MRRPRVRNAVIRLALMLVFLAPGGWQQPTLAQTVPTTLADAFTAASNEWNVPRDLLVAIAYAETRLDDHNGEPSIDNGYGLMHLADNPEVQTLSQAAALLQLPASTLQTDMRHNIRGGAALLDTYAREAGLNGAARTDLGAWYEVVARYSNAHDDAVAVLYADEVFRLLAEGISTTSDDGELLTVPARAITPQRGRYEDVGAFQAMSTDYGPAVWIPACDSRDNTCNFQTANRPYDGRAINTIVIHTTEGSYASAISWFKTSSSNVSAHYIIRSSDGHMTQMVREKDIAWHAGVVGWNEKSIGIEHEAYASQAKWFTDSMYRASAALTRHIALKYNIPMDRNHIIGHSEFKSTKGDPGPYWDWNYYMRLVTQSDDSSPRLTSARLRKTTVEAGEVLPVEFTVSNPSSASFETQAPASGSPADASSGWVYDEAECFLGTDSNAYPAYPKETGRLRVLLGFADGSARVPQSCASDMSASGWRWGLGSGLAPGETKTVVGYVRFRTPGQYQLKAGFNNENIKAYGTDGNGSELQLGTITVVPERRAPEISRFDGGMNPQASVYRLAHIPDSLLARTANPLSALETSFVGTFSWNGAQQRWGGGGPLGQSDRFVVRQARAFVAPTSGTYWFRLTSDDGAWLWIDGRLVVANTGLHPVTAAEGSIHLEAGLHTLAVKFFENTGAADMGYHWFPPGATEYGLVPLPPKADQIGSRFRPGQIAVVAGDDLGGTGLAALRYWVNGVERGVSTQPLSITLSDGAQRIEYEAQDSSTGSGRQAISVVVDSNFRPHRAILPRVVP